MNPVDPIFAYISILSIIQPARIQDIEKYSFIFFDKEIADWLEKKQRLRDAHKYAQRDKIVISVKKGVYFLSALGETFTNNTNFRRSLDNRRLFLMKKQRQVYK